MSKNGQNVNQYCGDRPWTDEETLRQLYVDEHRSLTGTGEILGCSAATVSNWLSKHGIERRQAGSQRSTDSNLNDPDVLRDLYQGQELSMTEIGERLGCHETTVLSRLKEFDIPRRRRGTETVVPELDDADELRRLHHEERLTAKDMASRFGVSSATVLNRMHELGVSVKFNPKTNFGLTAPVLHSRYIEMKKTAEEIADEFGCTHATVLSRLQDHQIPVRPQYESVSECVDDPEQLRRLYLGDQMTAREIARRAGCHRETVYNRLQEYGIGPRRTGPVSPGADELKDAELVHRLYVVDGRSTEEIADKYGCEAATVRNRLIDFGIERRDWPPTGEDHHWWTGGVGSGFYYGAMYYRNRPKVLKRDEYRCQRGSCGMSREEHYDEWQKDLEVHHIVPFDPEKPSEPQNQLSNLITLCKECHNEMQGLPIDNRHTGA